MQQQHAGMLQHSQKDVNLLYFTLQTTNLLKSCRKLKSTVDCQLIFIILTNLISDSRFRNDSFQSSPPRHHQGETGFPKTSQAATNPSKDEKNKTGLTARKCSSQEPQRQQRFIHRTNSLLTKRRGWN